MIKIILCGAAGRMGREIIDLARESDDIEIIAGIEARDNKYVGKTIAGIEIIADIAIAMDQADCIVDFTNHEATIKNLRKTRKHKKPYVTGTTGFSEAEITEIKNLSKEFPVFLAPNMSIGVNHLYGLVQSSMKNLADYDVEIIEMHHGMKKDAPSGTAKAIARIVEENKPGAGFIYGRKGMTGARKRGEVCISSVRGGDVVGEHRVLFLGNGEFLELRHFATSRQCFATGALRAARFIVGKTQGLYNMEDLLTGQSLRTRDE